MSGTAPAPRGSGRSWPPGARRLILWRHGRTAWNVQRRFQGQTDVPLDEMGLAQAEAAAVTLAELNPSAIFSSDLERARSTAQALGARVGVDVVTDQGLRETYAGAWEGLTHGELQQRYPDDLAAWASGEDIAPGGDGERRTQVADRVVGAIAVALQEVPVDGTLVVVTHGGAARAAVGRLMALPPSQWRALGVLANCAWSVLSEDSLRVPDPDLVSPAGQWRLEEYNAQSLPTEAIGDDE